MTTVVKRFLGVSWFLFLGVALIWPVTVMVIGLSIPAEPAQRHTDVTAFLSFRIDSAFQSEPTGKSGSENEAILSGRGDLKLNNTRGRISWYLSGAVTEVLLLVFLYGLAIMRRVFASLSEGNTFAPENADRIRTIGIVFIAWHILSPALEYLAGRMTLQEIALDVPGIHLYPAFEISIGGVFAGFAIIVFSGVLREAVSIHQDQALTI